MCTYVKTSYSIALQIGLITVSDELDREAVPTYQLVVTATDSAENSTDIQQVKIMYTSC